jgi:hypothetical protein
MNFRAAFCLAVCIFTGGLSFAEDTVISFPQKMALGLSMR